MKRIVGWMVVLALMVAGLGITVQAAEEEGTEIELETSVTEEEVESTKGLQEMWQIVKDAVEKVKERELMIKKAEEELAKATKEKDITACEESLKTHLQCFEEELESLYAASDKFGKWVEAQEIVETEVEEAGEESESEREEELIEEEEETIEE